MQLALTSNGPWEKISRSGIKSEIRSSKSETNPKKPKLRKLKTSSVYWFSTLLLRISDLFRVSDFEFRIWTTFRNGFAAGWGLVELGLPMDYLITKSSAVYIIRSGPAERISISVAEI